MSDTISIELRRLIDRVTGYLIREELDVFHVEMDCTVGNEPYWYVGGDVDEQCSHPSPIDWSEGDDETFFEIGTKAGAGAMETLLKDAEELDQRIADATFTDESGEGHVAVKTGLAGDGEMKVVKESTVKEFWNEFPGSAAKIDGPEVQEARREAANDADGNI